MGCLRAIWSVGAPEHRPNPRRIHADEAFHPVMASIWSAHRQGRREGTDPQSDRTKIGAAGHERRPVANHRAHDALPRPLESQAADERPGSLVNAAAPNRLPTLSFLGLVTSPKRPRQFTTPALDPLPPNEQARRRPRFAFGLGPRLDKAEWRSALTAGRGVTGRESLPGLAARSNQGSLVMPFRAQDHDDRGEVDWEVVESQADAAGDHDVGGSPRVQHRRHGDPDRWTRSAATRAQVITKIRTASTAVMSRPIRVRRARWPAVLPG